MISWLIGAGLGPAAVAVPVTWTADALAGAARRWFLRLHRADGLSRVVRAATGTSVDLTQHEFDAVRRLLEDRQFWTLAGRGTVQDLADRISSCLPPRNGRTAADSEAEALVIAQGLLEFAIAELEPKQFQQLLVARLERMEARQASDLDEAMLTLHADLVAQLAVQGDLGTRRFTDVMRLLKLVLERLPPSRAHRDEIAVYLLTLIDWLNNDPWPRDRRFDGPVLTPSAIERTLRVATGGPTGERDFDADDLTRRCERLVLLGGPGSGKTWLAKRATRRCAEDALKALAAGLSPDEIELPLYTTCSLLFSAGGDIRQAAVSSGLEQIADLGNSRLTRALRTLFTERNGPTLLVMDSLDEARGSDQRLRQADTLPWRLILTSRPSSWNRQLVIKEESESHQVGELQPLRYPGDVEPFIVRWFDQRPEWGVDLIGQIARRPVLQQAATVPLILAFYCIIGGSTPLPHHRHDLYSRVLRRLLTGRWRDSGAGRPDVDTCLETLRAWAWSAATSDPVSGVGTWVDDIRAEHDRLAAADKAAVDHIATPLGPEDVDTGKVLRRFVHRSIREHLVAEYVAGLPVDDAADALLPHLWYDPDWEYAVPAALAMHPQRDWLLQKLICRAARSDRVVQDLSVIDAGWEVRRLLARIVPESGEANWSHESVEMIGRTWTELAISGRIHDLDGAAHWGSFGRQVRSALLKSLAGETAIWDATRLVDRLAQLSPSAEDRQHACQTLLGLLTREAARQPTTDRAIRLLAALALTADEKSLTCEALLNMLADQADVWTAAALAGGVVELDPTVVHRRQARESLLRMLRGEISGQMAAIVVCRLAQLDPTAEDKLGARDVLLRLLLIDQRSASGTRSTDALVSALAQFLATAEDRGQAREAVLRLLDGQTDNTKRVDVLVDALVRLDPTTDEVGRARDLLLRLLVTEPSAWRAIGLADGLISLSPTLTEKRQAREAMLRLLSGQTDITSAAGLIIKMLRLDPTSEDKRHGRELLLTLLKGRPDSYASSALLPLLASNPEDKRRAREALLELLSSRPKGMAVGEIVRTVARLTLTEEDKRQARNVLFGWLASQIDAATGGVLIRHMVELDLNAEDRRQAREVLLRLMADQATSWESARLTDQIMQLSPTTEDKRQAREILLGSMSGQATPWEAGKLADQIIRLDPTADDKRKVRDVLLGMLADATTGSAARELITRAVQLIPTVQDKYEVRKALFGLLLDQKDSSIARELTAGVIQLDPTANDLRTWPAQALPPTVELVAAVRRKSPLAVWLAALPILAPFSDKL